MRVLIPIPSQPEHSSKPSCKMSNPQNTYQHTTFHGPSILSTRRKTISRVTVQTQLQQLRSTGRYDCFKLEWKPIYEDKSRWPVPPHLFWDSDLGKWIEGACYFLKEEYDADVDKAIQEIVETIRSAQQDDGYLNLHYMLVEPGKRWSNLQDMHELYNAGHLIEAALAHHAYYNNDLLLAPMLKYVSLIHRTFGPAADQLKGYPGHPEIELALFRLHRVTGSQDAYDLAHFFLAERGNWKGVPGPESGSGSSDAAAKHYFTYEREQRGESAWQRPDAYRMHREISYWYCQAHAPILEQTSVEGHAVRAMYLLTAVADLLCLEKEKDVEKDTAKQKTLANRDAWWAALLRLWDNMVDRKMYLTGGIGAIAQWEGFGQDYFLPQGTDEGGCYAETCASIGVMFLAERLLVLDLDARFADVMELCLYNGVLTAMSLDGRGFTYENQLASSEAGKSVREVWFECSCCPPNLTRLFGSLGGYVWHFGGESGREGRLQAYVNVHLYTAAKLSFEVGGQTVTLEQKTNWPWESNILFQLTAPTGVDTTIRLRLPGWSDGRFVLTPSLPTAATVEKGYLILPPSYTSAHSSFSLHILGLEPRYLQPHPYTNQNTLTLARGPIVYCVEDVDNPWEDNHFKDVAMKAGTPVTEERRVFAEANEEYVALKTKGWVRSMAAWEGGKAVGADPGLRAVEQTVTGERELVFVPYYFRANRGGKGHMRVGLLKA